MTHIYVVGSSSQGNSYILESDRQLLIVECGCRFEDICEPFYYKFGCMDGVCVTHCHGDHLNGRTATEFIRRGVPVYTHEEVLKDIKVDGLKPLVSGMRNAIGRFTVQTFETPHNVPNYGFLIDTPTKERIVFITDTTGVNLRFKNVNCIMVECNHDDDTLIDNFVNAEQSRSHPEYHMGLEQCIDFCKENFSLDTKAVILIHMSHQNINENHALKSVKDALCFDNVFVAHKGDKFEVENDVF